VGNSSTRSSTQIEDSSTGADVEAFNTTQNSGSELRSVSIPNSVFDLVTGFISNLDSLFVVNTFTRGQRSSDQSVFLRSGNENTRESMGFNGDFSTASHTTTAATSAATASTATSVAASAATEATTATTVATYLSLAIQLGMLIITSSATEATTGTASSAESAITAASADTTSTEATATSLETLKDKRKIW